MPSSVICQNFVQNAWKKELCSNCFKSKQEHKRIKAETVLKINANNNDVHVQGIMRSSAKSGLNGATFRQKRSVCFLNDLTQVIGYGGEDWYYSDNDEDDANNDAEDEQSDEDFVTIIGSVSDVDEELARQELTKLTKKNTDYNSTALKDITAAQAKKTYVAPNECNGYKQKLYVTITPYGEDSFSSRCSPPRKFVSHLTRSNNSKDLLTDTKSTVILKSYTKNEDSSIENCRNTEKSLLEEITETLENNMNPILSKKGVLLEADVRVKHNTNNGNNKENIIENGSRTECSSDNTKSTLSMPEKRTVNLSRTPALRRDQEKPGKLDLLNYKNARMNKPQADFEQDSNNRSTVLQTDKAPSEQNRELAGESDGRSHLDTSPIDNSPPPPALPTTPPPHLYEIQNSFLHVNTTKNLYDKPKVPVKPANTTTVQVIKKISPPNLVEVKNLVLTSFSCVDSSKASTIQNDDNNELETSPRCSVAGKRKAPQPPETTIAPSKQDSNYSNTSLLMYPDTIPDPAPRKCLSISSDNLNLMLDDKRGGGKQKGRFSLKRFLRMGGAATSKSSWNIGGLSSHRLATLDDSSDCSSQNAINAPTPKPRLVIVHPLDLNGAKVEVVKKPPPGDYQNVGGSKSLDDQLIYETSYTMIKGEKPPPPPRNFEKSLLIPSSARVVPLIQTKRPQKESKESTGNKEMIYANIGEVRSSIVPNKPQRTASMREREAQQEKRQQGTTNGSVKESEHHVYDYIVHNPSSSSSSSSTSSSSSRDGSDSNIPSKSSTATSSPSSSTYQEPSRTKTSPKPGITNKLSSNKRSESNVDVSSDYFKYQNIPRSVSLTYCGSETESEIYSPYSICGGSESEVAEDELNEWQLQSTNNNGIPNARTHKLRSRKGRSIVHKNLEDNYGAVIVANHEALAQVLENIQQTNRSPPILARALKTVPNLRWTDFTLKTSTTCKPVVLGNRMFHQAMWGSHLVTLMVTNTRSVSSNALLSLAPYNMNPLIEFSDLIPVGFLTTNHSDLTDTSKTVQATVVVLSWCHVTTIQAFSEGLVASKETTLTSAHCKDASFIMLQLVNAMKILQAHGIEELPLSLNNFVLYIETDKDTQYRLCILQHGLGDDYKLNGFHPNSEGVNGDRPSSSEELMNRTYGTLCACAERATSILQPLGVKTSLLKLLLKNERAVSLTQVKSVLELCLWGPTDVALGTTIRERDLAIQRWLDLQRATVLHGLVCTKVQLTVYEECHLMFLVRSNARMMCDASVLLDSGSVVSCAK